MTGTAIVSVHDVRPSSLTGVSEIVELLWTLGIEPVTLLVVPDAEWDDGSLGVLRRLVDLGCGLAGHGWDHRARRPLTWRHRAHASLISRDQAEHLSRSTEELLDRVGRCHRWFGSAGLPVPELYVPPAWALGALSQAHLAELPFRWYEVLSGFITAENGALRVVPLVGFEADTPFRQVALGVANGINLTVASLFGRPTRIAIHPSDLKLRLTASLRAILKRGWRVTTTESLLGA